MKYYDLLAIEPLNEKILNYINNGNFDCDLMTFSFADTKIVSSLKKANFSLVSFKTKLDVFLNIFVN